jgi:hypothetical protein
MNRSSLQAFAAGIILSTAIIADYQYLNNKSEEQGFTTNQAINMLKEKGYTISEKQSASEKQLDQPSKEIKNSKPQKKAVAVPNEKKHKIGQSPSEKKSGVSSFTLNIKSGMTTGDIASLLLTEGIIKDGSAFEKYMADKGLNEKIQIGEYIVTAGMTIQQIANTITN